ncbi:hypothetical protein ACLBR5_25400 [Escherichia coli]
MPCGLIAIKQRFLKNIVHVGKRHVFDFENMVDTRNTGQGVANSQTLVFIFCANFDVIQWRTTASVSS